MSYPDLPAGAMYNADLQCRLQFNTTDESVKVCSKIYEICTQLWCNVNDECVTQLRPAAEGTNCGKHMVRMSLLSKIHLFFHAFKMCHVAFSGVKIKNAFKSKIFPCQLMANGERGPNTVNVHVLVVAAFQLPTVSVIIQGISYSHNKF